MSIRKEKDFFGKAYLKNVRDKANEIVNATAYAEYELYMKDFFNSELRRAKSVTTLIGVKDFFVTISSYVPWQVNKITEKTKKVMDSIVVNYYDKEE
eukprot:CAMPEP_0170531404 /NCGR_PEP_ID=MMETSP0209-20121228/61490_1 /TAXON_ID=665100 ORGANISM="Litonotus pictus, Strain P1" /NCGR_SAMPLE_ID=MMETSP0209 /ASSEMBLY_ACC=CAM_ASM_000301 /LENGTH=96 /DNA_ID=CAMNT_0010825997 /DNA_START=1 /DNA_END=288 /DNA_ORIENTATION=-